MFVTQYRDHPSIWGRPRSRRGGGCNSYFGTYEATEDGSISIRNLTWTKMACVSPAGVMEQEMWYLNALGDVSAFEIRPDYLRLFYKDGQSVLIFVANPVERGIADVWMHGVDKEEVDYLVLKLKADNTYALGQHVGHYQIEPLEEGAYVWKEEEKVLEMTVTSSTQDPERVGKIYTYTEVEVTGETLSWTDEDGERMAFTRGILEDSPAPNTAVKSCTWGQIKRLLK
ncbi:MAG: META domain-containing protein [Candidatus Latescibacteria bacterium]|nr:META domain-containing protein [Candidatus Latescibacterota bacterium]